MDKQILVLNDQGGGQMDISHNITATLRAQDHGHPPLILQTIAFEPGVMSRCGGHIYYDIAGTVRANAGDNQQAVVYERKNEQRGYSS